MVGLSGKDRSSGKKIAVPSVFSGEGEIVFERNFNFTSTQISQNKMEIHFLGLNYTADISVNNNIIHRHPGGEFPFKIDLPRDILFHDKSNVISVKLNYQLDSESTIPVKQRFMFPHNYGGIIKDVYIKQYPNISIVDTDLAYTLPAERNSANFKITSRISNKEFIKDADTLEVSNRFVYKVRITAPDGQQTNISDYNFHSSFQW
jgi:beta-galactosidase/beta-glucuronidase